MRAFILALLLLIAFPAVAQVSPEIRTSNTGQPIFRVHNNTPYYLSCYYRDQYNYVPFRIAPYSVSMWYPIYSTPEWRCQ